MVQRESYASIILRGLKGVISMLLDREEVELTGCYRRGVANCLDADSFEMLDEFAEKFNVNQTLLCKANSSDYFTGIL